VVLADLAEAVRLAGLTERQRQALALVYDEDLTQVEAGKRMGGISKQAVEIYVSAACEKIADIYYYWASHGEGYVVGTQFNEGDASNDV
jgi:predicted DNA-binding protein (UPF0251 family)